jgi:hypothetical protein
MPRVRVENLDVADKSFAVANFHESDAQIKKTCGRPEMRNTYTRVYRACVCRPNTIGGDLIKKNDLHRNLRQL